MNLAKLNLLVLGVASVFVVTSKHSLGDIRLNEIFVNAPGTDDGQEFFELRSTTGGVESLAGLWFLAVEGDGANPGSIDVALNLGALSTGSNGLFLWRDSVAIINAAPNPATVVNVGDFAPDLENGSNTFMIVRNFTGAVALDIDIANNGTFSSTPWDSVIDSVGLIENDGAANVAYASTVGGTNFAAQAGFNADFLARDRITGDWIGGDVLGTSPGPYTIDPTRFLHTGGFNSFDTFDLTPGNENFAGITAVPEPSSFALLGLIGTVLVFGSKIKSRRTLRGRKLTSQ